MVQKGRDGVRKELNPAVAAVVVAVVVAAVIAFLWQGTAGKTFTKDSARGGRGSRGIDFDMSKMQGAQGGGK